MPEQRQITLDDVKNLIQQITPNQDWLYIFLPYSVGDFFNVGGLSHAVQKKKNKSATVLIAKDRLKNLGVTYANFADIIFLPAEIMSLISSYILTTGEYEGDNYIYGHFHLKPGGRGEYKWDLSLNLIDKYKKDVFKIPMDTPCVKPIVPPLTDENIAELHEKYFIDKDKTIVITPYAYSTKPLDMRFWMFLVMVLTEKGYRCYTSVNKDAAHEQPILGTEAMTINFREMHYISDKVKCFVGSRVGIFDFLGMTDAKTIDISPFGLWHCATGLLYPDSNSRTFYNAVDYIAPFLETSHKDNVHAEIKLSHEHIKSEDVCYSYEEIFNKVLNEIEKV